MIELVFGIVGIILFGLLWIGMDVRETELDRIRKRCEFKAMLNDPERLVGCNMPKRIQQHEPVIEVKQGDTPYELQIIKKINID